MVVYCVTGNGTIRVNGTSFTMTAGRYLFLPWNHAITYAADTRNPMLLLGVHIIPVFRPTGKQVEYIVPHRQTDRFFNADERSDAVMPGLEGVNEGGAEETSTLALLLRFVVEWFRQVPRQETAARSIARLLLDELQTSLASTKNESPVPVQLRRVIDYARENIAQKLSIGIMAEIAECSPSTLSRMIRKCFEMSPIQWLLRMRMDHAGILLSTTGIRIGEVGIRSGFEDPYYFSKLFKKHHGMTAREYRRRNSLF
jgi:AraC-like DNA-binding protein